ncbi:beta-glucosidase BglX [candidate division KSB1 bacterium]|nr:beta-glucosidase BglX [candidate division KSB1 bacterium]
MKANVVYFYVIFCFYAVIISANLFAGPDLKKEDEVIEKKVNELLAQMTVTEKIGQLQQLSYWGEKVPDELAEQIREGRIGSFLNAGDLEIKKELQKIAVKESRLGIPLIFGRDVIHGYRTVFPIPLGQAASWNPAIIEKAAAVAAKEASADGIHWTFAPMIDIARDPRWGRIAETCGEDPFLTSTLGAAMVRGFQGKNLADPQTIAACGKHYVGYGAAEGGRDYNTCNIPERELRDIYLPTFHAAVEAGVATIMSAFNEISGVPASGNEFTLRTVLRDEWGFDGFVVSDWTSMTEMIAHGFCKDNREVALKSMKAGVNMEMVSTTYATELEKLITEGLIPEKLLNESVANILRIKFRLGLFDHPVSDGSRQSEIFHPDFLKLAKQAALQSVVMLKNDNNSLPLSGDKTIAVIGPLADSPVDQMGMWTMDGRSEDTQTPLSAIKEKIGENHVKYAPGLKTSRTVDKAGFEDAVKAAEASDAVVLFLGEEQILSGEAKCRAFLNLPGAQEELVEVVAGTGKPVIVVIMAGRPLTFQHVTEKAGAVLYAWHPGTMGGPALADILFGVVSPSGKLPVTFPRTVGQVPIYYAHKNTGRPPSPSSLGIPMGTPLDPQGFTSKYLDVDFTPEYVFGYGLSYTTFEYSNLKLSAESMPMDGSITVSADITNTGDVKACEIVQLYVRDLFASVTRPVKELKGFQRILLEPGESKTATFTLKTGDLTFHDINMNNVTEPGDFKVWIGPNSKQGLEGGFKVVE